MRERYLWTWREMFVISPFTSARFNTMFVWLVGSRALLNKNKTSSTSGLTAVVKTESWETFQQCLQVHRVDAYSCNQKFKYTCTYHGSLQFQWFLHYSFFSDGMSGTKNIHEVCFKSESIIKNVKMWPNLLVQRYRYINLNDQFRWLLKVVYII